MVSVIILSAGNSTRMGGVNKQLAKIDGVPVFILSALAFEKCERVGEIIIVAPKDDCAKFEKLAVNFGVEKLSCVTEGGNSRFQSMKNALDKVSQEAEFVAFHDGARPLITAQSIEKVLDGAEEYGAAIAGIPAVDTVKVAENGFVSSTPERSTLYYAQTPQVFKKELFLNCLDKLGANAENVTDDSSILELCGEKVRITEIADCNMKITKPDDLYAVQAVYSGRKAVRNI